VRETVRHLSRGVAIYGAGDAAVQVVNLLLLAVYVKQGHLRDEDYGTFAVIIGVEMIAKIVSRWGLDGAFMRFYHERPLGGPLERLTSTIIWFVVAADIVVFGVALTASGRLGQHWFPMASHLLGFQLMLANTFLISLTFVPFHLMRLRNEAVAYSGFVFARSAGTVLLRALLVIGLGWGVPGWFAADLAMTLLLWPVLWRRLSPLLRATFSKTDLGLALRFGLPRLPHGLAQQGLDAGNKLLLAEYIPRADLGVYQNGFTLGTAVRFFTSAFETAWAPFYYATSRQDGAAAVFAKVATYGVAVLALLVAITVAVARDAVLVMLTPDYLGAARVIPLIALGMALQGVYLLTSIGLNLTSQTRYYPVATFAALTVGLAAGAVLMPRFGIDGAAAAFLASTATQTLVALGFAQRFYPVPYEIGRLVRVLVAGVAAALAGIWLVPNWTPLLGLAARTLVAATVYGALLAASGFLRKTERAFLADVVSAMRRRGSQSARSAKN
jgi:O-antigen/teichoic acid export membrane protein